MMKTLYTLIIVSCLLLGVSVAVGQNTGNFQTVQSGNWNNLGTWSYDGGIAPAPPDSSAGTIEILGGHSVVVTSDIVVDSVQVDSLATLTINAGVTVTIGFNKDGYGIKVLGGGTMIVNGYIRCLGRVSNSANGTLTFANGSTLDHARDAGSLPTPATWATGSNMLLTGLVAKVPSNANQNFYNVLINCPLLTANLNLSWTGNTIYGDIICSNTGAFRIYFTSPTAYAAPINLMGNVIVTGGTLSTNGSSSSANIVINQYGNIRVTGGNFGTSRGSAPTVTWNFYGDSLTASACSLVASSSGLQPQKFVFIKAGTQYVRVKNLTGNIPKMGFHVTTGTTLDIGTSFDTLNSSGGFVMEPGSKVISQHLDPINQGRLRFAGAFGEQSNCLDINVSEGSGTVTVTAFQGNHPGILASSPADTATMLDRYWRTEADQSISKAKITMYYNDRVAPSDIRGKGIDPLIEFSYQAIKLYQFGSEWRKWVDVDSSYSDDVLDQVITGTLVEDPPPMVSRISGDWTGGAGIVSGIGSSSAQRIPESFYVKQNFPNPFNPTTQITYGLPRNTFVTVKVYNMLGQEVANLFAGQQVRGEHTVTFDASRLSSGVYVYRVQAGNFSEIKKMVLMK